jgi:Zn-dependent peptidase ImmA (M78 family)
MNRSDEIEELASLVASESSQSGQVDVGAIASAYGLTFTFGHYEGFFDGLLECKAARFHVYINLDSSRTEGSPRSRFSFAHELGHFFLDWHRVALERGAPSHGSKSEYVSTAEIEREADFFAANLLLPRERVRCTVGRQRVGSDAIRLLAKDFGTSLTATAIRCTQLNLAPMIVMRWSDSGRAWCWSSTRFTQLTGNGGYRSLDRIPRDSLTRETLDGNAREGFIPNARGSTLSTWFPSVKAGTESDELLVEECISLGRYGALTILRHP